MEKHWGFQRDFHWVMNWEIHLGLQKGLHWGIHWERPRGCCWG